MRKLIGLVMFVISAVIIASVLVGSGEIISDFIDDLGSENFLTQVGLFASFFLNLLFQPIIVLLLSLITMADFSK